MLFGYGFRTGQAFGVPPLRANKRTKTCPALSLILYVKRFVELEKYSLVSFWAASLSGSSSGEGAVFSAGVGEVVVINPPVLGDLELLFEMEARGWGGRLEIRVPSSGSCKTNRDRYEISYQCCRWRFRLIDWTCKFWTGSHYGKLIVSWRGRGVTEDATRWAGS